MIRISKLRNCPVICGDKQTGLLQSMILDETRKRVYALIVSGGMRGKKIVPAMQVQVIADGFILVNSVIKFTRELEKAVSPFIRDTTGLLVGCIRDYALDEKTLDVLAVEMIPGYCPTESRIRTWVYEYACDDMKQGEMIVPACLGSELIKSGEENGICVCPP